MESETLTYLKKLANNSDIMIWKLLVDYRESLKDKIEQLVNTKNRIIIWNLCDGNHKVSDIANEISKSQPYISMEIKNWLDNRILFEVIRGNSKFLISIDSMIDMIFNNINWEIYTNFLNNKI